MARLPDPTTASLTPEAQALYDRMVGQRGRLGAFQRDELQVGPVVMHRNTPLAVVIAHHQRISTSPGAAFEFVHRLLPDSL